MATWLGVVWDCRGVMPRVLALGVAVLLTATLACCGTTSSSGGVSAEPRVATVDASQLDQPGHLLFCSDIPSPPQEFYDSRGSLLGSDVDLGNEIAARLGLQPVWVNSVFDTIIEAADSGKCDAILSGAFITPDRLKQIDMIPYFTAGQSILVQKGNPAGIGDWASSATTLCGKRVVVVNGSAEADTVKGMSDGCKAAGKPDIAITNGNLVSDSLQQLQTGHVDAFSIDSPIASYYAKIQPDQFQVIGGILQAVEEGIGVPKGKASLEAGIVAALRSAEQDGSYNSVLKKWGEAGTPIPPPS